MLSHPRRAHSAGPMASGLQNQVAGLKLCRRRKRSPRSHTRPLPAAAPPPLPPPLPPSPLPTGLAVAWRARSLRWGRYTRESSARRMRSASMARRDACPARRRPGPAPAPLQGGLMAHAVCRQVHTRSRAAHLAGLQPAKMPRC